MSESDNKDKIIKYIIEGTSSIVSGYLAGNEIGIKKIPEVIQTVYRNLHDEVVHTTSIYEKKPAVRVEDSVHGDYIICLEDGKKLKMLRRYLKTKYGMVPDEYREKWKLPNDYPMVAPNYAKKRSKLAVDSGLGKK